MRGWGCCTASLLKVWYFAILMMFWKFNLDMCILSYCTHYCQKSPENGHAWPVIEGPKLKCYTLPPPLNEGLALINSVFVQPVLLIRDQRHLKLGQCLEIDYRRSSVNLVMSHDLFYRLFCILQTGILQIGL